MVTKKSELSTAKASSVTAKDLLQRAIVNLPEDVTMDQAVDALYLALKVGKGKAEVDEGKGVSQEDVEESLSQWLA